MNAKPNSIFQSQWVIDFNNEASGKVELTEAALLSTARKETKLEHFGNEKFLQPLRILLNSLETEANLNPFGRTAASSRIIASLKNQLWANACFEAYPEILQRKIESPIVIVGPHRSGTTRMLQLLATDERLQHLKAWQGVNPSPRLNMTNRGAVERYQEAKLVLQLRQERYPEAHMAHPMHPDWAEEEMLLMNHSFSGFSPLGFYVAPGYLDWFMSDQKEYGYRNMADLMRLISWSNKESENKRWVLKNPQHMLNLPTLLGIFPDAKLVFMHRDPIKSINSVLSLMWWCAVQHTDLPCSTQIRDTWLLFCETAARRCIESRKTIATSQMMDVNFEDMNHDWRIVMRRVYDFIGMEFTPHVEQAMEALIVEDSDNKRFGQCPKPSLEDFGIKSKEVDDQMMFVRKQYAIPYEALHERSNASISVTPTFIVVTEKDYKLDSNKLAQAIFTEACKRLGIPLKFIYASVSARAVLVETAQADCEIARVRKFGDRHPDLIRVEETLFEINFSFFTTRSYLSQENMVANLNTPTRQVQFPRDVLLCQNILDEYFPQAKISGATDYREGIENLLRGESDLFCGIEQYVHYFKDNIPNAFANAHPNKIRKVGIAKTEPVFPYLHKKHANLAERLGTTLREMKNDGWFSTHQNMFNKDLIFETNLAPK